jgi:hypothetical protein
MEGSRTDVPCPATSAGARAVNPRSRSRRPAVCVLLTGVCLIFGTSGIFPSIAQEAASPKTGDVREAQRSDASDPAAQLRLQRLRTRKARAVYEIARLNRELAEIAVEEYPGEAYANDLAVVDGEIKLAESDLVRTEDRLAWAKRMFAKGFIPRSTLIVEELSFEKAKYTLEQARSKKRVLVGYTGPKNLDALRRDVDKTRRDEANKREAWEREALHQAALERLLDRT